MSGVIPHSVSLAARDRRIRGVTLSVYITLFDFLTWEEYRPAKLVVVGRRIGLRKPHVSRALSLLVQHGYIARGPDRAQASTYRLEVCPYPFMVTTEATR